jgi:hypothetical protein
MCFVPFWYTSAAGDITRRQKGPGRRMRRTMKWGRNPEGKKDKGMAKNKRQKPEVVCKRQN